SPEHSALRALPDEGGDPGSDRVTRRPARRARCAALAVVSTGPWCCSVRLIGIGWGPAGWLARREPWQISRRARPHRHRTQRFIRSAMDNLPIQANLLTLFL